MESGLYLNSRTTSFCCVGPFAAVFAIEPWQIREGMCSFRALGCFDPTCNKKVSDSLDLEANWLTLVMCPTPTSGHVKIICKVTTLWLSVSSVSRR